MNSIFKISILCLITAISFTGCYTIEPPELESASSEEIKSVLKDELVVFDSSELPDSIIKNLSQFKAVIIGEFHTILEERVFAASLTLRLNELNGYTEVCAECPNAYSWAFEKAAVGQIAALPDNISYNKIIPILDSLALFNMRTGSNARLICIDANMQPYQFLNSFKSYAEFLDNTILLEYYEYLNEEHSDSYEEKLIELKAILQNSPGELELAANNEAVDCLLRMIENELKSIDIRINWNSDYNWSFNAREELIKTNAEYYLAINPGTTVFYFGLNHAQKKGFMGSKIIWLGDYLHHQSEFAAGRAISIAGIPLKGEITNGNSGNGTITFDLVNTSDSNDLFRLVGEQSGEKFAWLPLGNKFFEENIKVKYIYTDNEIIAPVGQQFDAYYIFPTGTYAGW